MAKKPKVKTDIREATQAIRIIMQENLAAISSAMIDQIMANYRSLPPSKRLDSTKGITPSGINTYRDALKNALAVTAYDSLEKARKEVPKKKNVRLSFDDESLKLGDYKKLPPDIRKRIDTMLSNLVGTQIADIEKIVFFQFSSSVDSTDSEDILRKDLQDGADDYVGGANVNGGASAAASQIINEARQAFFLDDDVQSEIEAFQFVNGDPVSPICTELDGKIFAKDDPALDRYWPPLHFNCKSFISPVLTGNLGNREINEISPSNRALKSIQFSEQNINTLIQELKKPGPDTP